MCLVCLRQVLILSELSPIVFEYLINLPPPSYNYAKFSDWMRPFIENYIAESKRYYSTGHIREANGNEALSLFNSFEEKLNLRIAYNEEVLSNFRGKNNQALNIPEEIKSNVEEIKPNGEEIKSNAEESQIVQNKEEEEKKKKEVNDANPLLKMLTPRYVIGETASQDTLREFKFAEEVTVFETQVSVFITESLPTGTNNRAFPSSIVKESYISAYYVKPDSALAHFIQPKNFSNAAAHNSPPRQAAASSNIEYSVQEYPPRKVRIAEPHPEAGTELSTFNGGSANNNFVPPAQDTRTKEPEPVEECIQQDNEPTKKEPPAAIPDDKIQKQQTQENSSPVQVTDPQNVEIIELDDTTFVYELNPMLRKFVAVNKTTETYTVSITLTPKSKGFLNFWIPCSTYQATLKPLATINLLTIVKILPEVDWAEYDFHCDIQKVDSSANNKSGNNAKEGEDQAQSSVKRSNFNIRKIETNQAATGVEHRRCTFCFTLNSPLYQLCKECFSELES